MHQIGRSREATSVRWSGPPANALPRQFAAPVTTATLPSYPRTMDLLSAPLGVAVENLLGLLSDWDARHAPTMALQGRSRIGATPVLPMPIRMEAQRVTSAGARSLRS
jgi:hypothetical protein